MADEDEVVDTPEGVDADGDPLAGLDDAGARAALAAQTPKEDQQDGETDTPAEDAGEEPEAGTPEHAAWDKERQQRDQELANLRKEKARLEAELQAVKGGSTEEDVTEYPSADELALRREINELKPLEPLDSMADDAERAAREAERERRQLLRDRLSNMAFEREQRQADRQAASAMLNDVCRKYGEDLRNDLVDGFKTECAARGYDGKTSWPGDREARDMLRVLALELRAAKPKPTPTNKTEPKKPAATGGARSAPPAAGAHASGGPIKAGQGKTFAQTASDLRRQAASAERVVLR